MPFLQLGGIPVNRLQMIFGVLRTYVLTQIPQEYEDGFEKELYTTNTRRFSAQSIILAGMDSASLLVYFLYYLYTGHLLWPHLLLHAAKIIINLCLFVYYSSAANRSVIQLTPRQRWANILFPALHGLLEFLLFALGPQDFGALVRFLAVPFIMGTVTLISQARMFMLATVYYALQSFYLLRYTAYGTALQLPGFIINLLVVYFCAILVSALVYASFVNNYLHSLREMQAHAELNTLNARLDILSRRDQLTGLSNRRDFENYLQLTLEEQRSRGASITLMMLDIDFFKYYNDRFGHLAGDQCLVDVTRAVQQCLAGTDNMFSRYGGEEFLLLLYGEEHADMVVLAEKMRSTVEQLHIENPDSPASPFLTVSIGVHSAPACTPQQFQRHVQTADECLYHAKKHGRNRVVHLQHGEHQFLGADNLPLSVAETGAPLALPDNTEQLSHAIKEVNLNCTFLFSRQHGIVHFSPYASELLGMPGSVVAPTLGKVIDMLPLAHEESAQALKQIRRAFDEGLPLVETNICLRQGAEKQWVALRMQCLYEDGRISVASGSFFLIHKILAFSSYSFEKAMISSVSLLPNRKAFYTDIEQLLAQGTAKGCIVVLDISNFKSINSIFSHNIGDKVLRKVGSLIAKMVKHDGNVYHYAVDQFVLLLKDVPQSYVESLVGRILHFFSTYDISIDGIAMRVVFAAGATMFSGTQLLLDDLLLNLDVALQKAKLQHGQGYCMFSETDKEEYLARMTLEKEISLAADTGFPGFALHYQPLFSTGDRRCLGAEALLRFTTKQGAAISPLVVVSILEKTGHMRGAGLWILRSALQQCRVWIDAGAPDNFYVHVNLSIHQLENLLFADEVLELITDSGLLPHNLVLELTEGALMSENGDAISILRTLRTAGVRVAVDDFGTGYSSLSYLRRLPADEIKIDKSFLDGIETDDNARVVLHAVTQLAKAMGYTVCMEGAENNSHMDFLKDTSVDLLQGYLLGRPVPPQDFERKWIAATRRPDSGS